MLKIYLLILTIFSLIEFILFPIDKRKAILNKNRIPEFTLLSLSCFGGAIGAFLAMIIFRHKTDIKNKFYFEFVIFINLLIQIGLLIIILFPGLI